MKQVKKTGVCLLALLLVLGLLASPFQAQAAGKTALNKTKATLAPGESVQLKLKNAPKGKSVKWSSSKKSVATVTGKGKVTAKKAGKAKITATVGKKSYSCTVTVKNSVLTNTKGKNASDVKALEKIIADQLQRGATVSTDLNHYRYYWDGNGRLVGIDWSNSSLSGSLDLKGLSALKEFSCFSNKLNSLNVSGCPALESLNCAENQLTALDLSKNTALLSVYCFLNKLGSLNVSSNKALVGISCEENQIESLDVSQNTALSFLSCRDNKLGSLNVSSNKELTYLYCTGNQITSLDLTNNTKLSDLECDDAVTVIGYQPGQSTQ